MKKTYFLIPFLLFVFFLKPVSARKYLIPADQDVLISSDESLFKDAYLNPSSIKVLVWNMYKGSNHSWSDDFIKLSSGKDLLVLQESYLNQKMNNTFSKLDDFFFTTATAWIKKSDNYTPSGVSTASRGVPSTIAWQRSYFREPIIRTPKMALFTKYKLAGVADQLLVGNIHAINFVGTKKLVHMLNRAAEVFKIHTGPAIFAGDFNTWNKSKISNMKIILKRLGFQKVHFKKDYRKKFMGNILDYVWVKNLKVLSAKVPKVTGSDHAPMTLELSLY